MTIAISIYVDHQDVIKYPINFVTSNLDFADEIFMFGSNDLNLSLAKAEIHKSIAPKTTFVNLEYNITSPNHIAIAQNKCYDHIMATTDHDLIVILQASRYLLPSAIDLIVSGFVKRQDICWNSPIDESVNINLRTAEASFCLSVAHVFMFHEWYESAYGIAIMNRHTKYKYDEVSSDGAYPQSFTHVFTGAPNVVDIGKYSPQMYCDKLKQHSHTWRDLSGLKLADLWSTNKEEFIAIACKDFTDKPWIDVNNEHVITIMDGLKLWDEYELVRRLSV